MVRDDDIDRRAWLRSQPSYGPDWDAAIEFGIDVTLIEENLALTMAERFQQSLRMTKFALMIDSVRAGRETVAAFAAACGE